MKRASVKRGASVTAGLRGASGLRDDGDQRYTFAYIYGAVEPGTDNAFALILPEVSANAMQVYLDKPAETIDPDEHVLLVLDQAGWHEAKTLRTPASITLEPLPPRSPELNPVERGIAVLQPHLPWRSVGRHDAG